MENKVLLVLLSVEKHHEAILVTQTFFIAIAERDDSNFERVESTKLSFIRIQPIRMLGNSSLP